ncbi:MAG: hypothetical protein K0R19_3525 [Bacillota bacterium]|nr:hypothetical protein [Bacillota bacterium]
MKNQYEKAFFSSYIIIHQKSIERFIASYITSNEDALDIVQNTFECAWKKMHQLKDPEKAKSWLFSIAYNEIRMVYRKQKRDHTFVCDSYDENDINEIEDKSDDFVEEFNRQEDYQRLHTAIKYLTAKNRRLLLLRYVEELSLKEIADVLNINYNSIRVYITRAKQELKEIYQGLDAEELKYGTK